MDNEKKIPASKQIRQRNEDVIIKATEIITELESLESFSLEKKGLTCTTRYFVKNWNHS